MDAIKLWKIGGSADKPIITDVPNVSQTKTEEMLEDILVKVPSLLLNGLTLVGRQVETGSGPLDLLGVDEDGELIVFELKRGILTRDAVAQVIDYTSYLANLNPSALSEFISTGSGKKGIDKIDFDTWYKEEFPGKSVESIGKPRMMLVGLGVDGRAKRMVEFLAARGVDISLITFHGFSNEDGTYLAKQIELLQKSEAQSIRVSKEANLKALQRRVQEAGVKDLFEQVTGVLRASLDNSYEWPNQSGYAYYLQDITDAGTPSNRAYVSLSVLNAPKGALLLTFQDRAIQAAGLDWSQLAQTWGDRVAKKKGYSEVKILSEKDWAAIAPDLKRLCSAILRGRQMIQKEQMDAEREGLKEEINDAGDGVPLGAT